MKSDLDIATNAFKKDIRVIAKEIGISEDCLELYGNDKAKVDFNKLDSRTTQENLILVTSINPTPAGEGKSTTTIGLADGIRVLGESVIACLREPSLGPVFGLKGGATGGGYSQVIPMEDINLHFTGDMHAITTANNLICATIDNHIHHGNELDIDLNNITFKRVMDMNDRSLREITIAQGSKFNGIERKDGFNISVASEIMAILCLSSDLMDFKRRISNIIIGYNADGEAITVEALGIKGAVTVIMKDAIKPNLVQTIEHTPVLMHGGPFANIAHGCNSLIATKTALNLADYVVTEAGFGADLGSEKFIDLKCRIGKLKPKAIVIVATIRALKMHGGLQKSELKKCNVGALEVGVSNLEKHIDTIKQYGINYVITINKFDSDSELEIDFLTQWCKDNKHEVSISDCWSLGSKGCIDLAKKVIKACNTKSNLQYIYELEEPFKVKVQHILKKVYGGRDVVYTNKALSDLDIITANGFGNLPICMAKTPSSLSDDASLLGAPQNFDITVTKIQVSAGAGFLVVFTGNVMTMPGLGKSPAAMRIDIDSNGIIEGLF